MTSPGIEPTANDTDGNVPARREPPAFAALPVPSRIAGYPVGNTPFEQFGLDVVYGLVGVLREDSTTKWKLFEYNIGTFDGAVRTTYGADSVSRPVEPTDLSRSESFICGVAAKQLMQQLGRWSVEMRFVHWDDGQLVSGPFTVRQSDCR